MDIIDSPTVGKLYSLRAAASVLGASRSTMIRWIREGKVRSFKLPDGRLWRIRESDLLAFIDAGEVRDLEDPFR